MTTPEVRKESRGEWVLTSDMDTARIALSSMLRKRKLSQNGLAALMGASSTSMFSNFIAGKQANLRLDSLARAAEAMDFEIVVRERAPKTKTKERLAELKAERTKRMGIESARELSGYADIVADDDPDRDLKLRMLGGMKDPEHRGSLEALFRSLRAEEEAGRDRAVG